MIPYSDWLAQCEKLKEGQSRRVSHACGDGNPLVIEHTQEGYRTYCHRCHDSGFKPHGRRNLDKQLRAWEERYAEIATQYRVKLPSDLTDEIPSAGSLWLSRGGITNDLRRNYGIQYSPTYGRVILPVYDSGRLVYYQARAVHAGQTPKYLNPAVDKSSIRFTAGQGSTAVACEDILSAIRVGSIMGGSTYTGVSILGTSPSVNSVNYLATYKRVLAWFDPDEAGRKATLELTKKLSLVGKTVTVIKSDHDPKIYNNRELKEVLQCHSI